MTPDEETYIYGELCDLFEQAWAHIGEPILDEGRLKFTSTETRRYANAVMELVGIDEEER